MDASPILHLPPGAPLHLGQPIKMYRQDIRSRVIFAARLLVWMALVIGFGYLYLFLLRDEEGGGTRQSSDLLSLVIGVGMIGWVSAVAIPGIYRFLTQWHDTAIEYSAGIAYFHRGTWHAARWNEITEVTRKERPVDYWSGAGGESLAVLLVPIMAFLSGSTRRYTICTTDSTTIPISDTLGGSKQLMDTLQGRTFINRKERAMAVLQAGQNAVFGPVYVSLSRGISKGAEAEWYAWEAAQAVRGEGKAEDYIALKPSRGLLRWTIKIMEGDIPNGDILLSLTSDTNEWTR